jgi:hypothetical protein
VEVETRVEPCDSTVLHNILGCLKGTFILIAGSYSSSTSGIREARLIAIGHKDGDLSADFCQFEWAYIAFISFKQCQNLALSAQLTCD